MGAISWIVDSLLYEEAVAEAEEEQRLRREQATREQMEEDEEDGLDDQVKFARGAHDLPGQLASLENFDSIRVGESMEHSCDVMVKLGGDPCPFEELTIGRETHTLLLSTSCSGVVSLSLVCVGVYHVGCRIGRFRIVWSLRVTDKPR